jgi:hypothetical protein
VLIANTSMSPKYNVAVFRKIPIVSRAWIDACCEYELTYEYEKFPFKFFTDCVVCVTGFQLEERKEIQEMVEKNGGKFRPDLEKDVVTHLIAKQTSGNEEPTGPKYRHARMWGISVLSKKWVDDCVRRGVKLYECEYDVKNGISNSIETDASLEKQPAVPLPTKEELTKELEEEYDEDQTPWGQHYLFSTKVYLVGFNCNNGSTAGGASDPNDILKPSAKNARLAHKILRAGGATIAMNPQKATHVVVNDDVDCQKDVDFILRTYMRPHREKCVTFEWLKKCSEEGRTMPKSKRFRVAKERFSEVIEAPTFCNDHPGTMDVDKKTSSWTHFKKKNASSPPRRIPERSPLKVIDKDKNPLRRQPTLKKDDIETQRQHAAAAADDNSKRSTDKHEKSRRDINKNDTNNAMTEQIPETRAAVGETALLNNEDEDDALLMGRTGYNSRNESSGEHHHSSKESQRYPLANVKLSLFEGLCIGEKEVALNLISLLGGTYVRGSSISTLACSDFIICPALPSTSDKKKLRALASDIANAARETPDAIFSARFVAPHFLEGVSLEGKLFKPSESIAYQPYMNHEGKFPSMKSVVLSPSSYTEREKSAIRMLSFICGCECTENLKKGKNTHVVVSKAEGSKYKAGMSWNKKVVTKEWLEECAKKGRKVDESMFAPPLPGAMLEETQAEETNNDASTAAAKRSSDPSIGGGGGGGGEKTVEKTAEKKIVYVAEKGAEDIVEPPPMDAPMDEDEDHLRLELPPPPPPVVAAHQHQVLPTSAMKTPSATTKTTAATIGATTNTKPSSLEHLKTHSRFQHTPGPSTAKKTPNMLSSQQTNGSNKNIAAIPIQKIATTTAKKSPSKQPTSQHLQQWMKSGSVVKRNLPSQHHSPPQPSIDGKRKLPLTSTTTQKKRQNSASLLSPMLDDDDEDGNVNDVTKPSPMNLFNDNNREAAAARNANLNMLMMKSPSPAKNNNNTNNTNEDGFDDNSDLALPDFKVGGIGATLPNTLNIALGSAHKNNYNEAGGENPSSTLNMETQVGYGNAASHAHHQTASKLEALRSRRTNTRGGGGALNNLIGGTFRNGGKSSPSKGPDPTTDMDNKDEWMK